MNIYTIKGIFVFIGIITMFFIFKNIVSIFTNRDSKLDKKRKDQLKFDKKRTSSQDMNTIGLVNTITIPVRKLILSNITIEETKLDKLEKDIKLANWIGFTPLTFIALDITLKILGCALFLFFIGNSLIMATLYFSVFFFGVKVLFKNSISNRKYNLMAEFPDFISITEGYLSSNIELVEAIENTLPYVGTTWKPILKEFIIDSNVKSQYECIEILKNNVPIFEVHELWSLIQLNLDQGINIKECFSNQEEKIKEMQKDVMVQKITKRQILATLIQAPLLLCMMLGFGLPTLYTMMNFNIG